MQRAARLALLLTALVVLVSTLPSPGADDALGAAEETAAARVAPRPSAGCARREITHGRRIEQTIEVDGLERSYVLDVPDSIRAGEPVPLLFDFHGIGHSGAGVWNVSGFKDLAEKERFITVYPDGDQVSFTRDGRTFSGRGWEIRTLAPNRDVAFTLAMLDRLEQDYCIDRARVFATGFSNGGFFSHVLACTHADRFAAVAPVSGGWLSWRCAPSRPVPVLIHHGRRDEIIDVAEARRAFAAWQTIDGCSGSAAPDDPATSPAEDGTSSANGTTCQRAERCRANVTVEYCEGDFAHRWPAPATERIWRFLAAHPLPAAEATTPGAAQN
ncbi:MAG TPA: PHB depolymerase family esterase [Candidatus Binatia bacterium]